MTDAWLMFGRLAQAVVLGTCIVPLIALALHYAVPRTRPDQRYRAWIAACLVMLCAILLAPIMPARAELHVPRVFAQAACDRTRDGNRPHRVGPSPHVEQRAWFHRRARHAGRGRSVGRACWKGRCVAWGAPGPAGESLQDYPFTRTESSSTGVPSCAGEYRCHSELQNVRDSPSSNSYRSSAMSINAFPRRT